MKNFEETTPESNEQLISRYNLVKSEYDKAVASYQKMKFGNARTKKAKWAGCLNFTLLSIKAEMYKRGIS